MRVKRPGFDKLYKLSPMLDKLSEQTKNFGQAQNNSERVYA